MAFDKTTFNPGMQPGKRGKAPVLHSYSDDTDTLSTILADGYFDEVGHMFTSGDLIYVDGSDGEGLFEITATSTGDVSLAAVGNVNARVVTLDTAGETADAMGVVKLGGDSGQEFKLNAPRPGVAVTIVASSTSTDGQNIVPNDTGDIKFDIAGNRKLTFDAQDEAVVLMGLTSTQFVIASNVGSVAAAST